MLVCVNAVGLTHLAVRRPVVEHTIAMSIVLALAAVLMVAAPFAAALLALSCMWTRRLATGVLAVPDRLPRTWG